MAQVERRFEMPWDGAMRASTAFFVLLVLGVGLGLGVVVLGRAGDDPMAALAGLVGPLVALVLVPVTWALAPRALTIGGGMLRVERPLRPVEVPLGEVRAVGRLPGGAPKGIVRVGGSGGAFGSYGRFWSRDLGLVRVYATRRSDHVLVDTDQGRFLLTPGEPDAFVAALLRAARQARPLGALGPPVSAARPLKLLVAVALAVPLVVGGALAAAWALAPTSVRLEGDAVVVARNWAGPVVIPVAPGSARPVEPGELRGLRRVAGTSWGGVRFGSFRSGPLGPFQLYAPRWGPAFLVETPEGRVVVMPDDPAAFEEGIGGR
jgi:hypothetical protein